MDRREFLNVLAIASAAGLPISSREALAAADGSKLYDVPRFGNVSLLHMTDCHAQLMPIYFREPNVNIGIAGAAGRAPHLVGEHLLKAYGVKRGSDQAHAFTYLDFPQAAKTYGKVGGFAHLATLVKNLKASRPGALLLDGGDTWQGSGTALWTKGQDMVDAWFSPPSTAPLALLQGPSLLFAYRLRSTREAGNGSGYRSNDERRIARWSGGNLVSAPHPLVPDCRERTMLSLRVTIRR